MTFGTLSFIRQVDEAVVVVFVDDVVVRITIFIVAFVVVVVVRAHNFVFFLKNVEEDSIRNGQVPKSVHHARCTPQLKGKEVQLFTNVSALKDTLVLLLYQTDHALVCVYNVLQILQFEIHL